jgi:hypothetical protein
MMNRTRHALRNILKKKQDNLTASVCFLGNLDGVVDVPGRRNYVYVRTSDRDVHEVYNKRVRADRDKQVLIGYDPIQPNLLQVLTTTTTAVYGQDDINDSGLPLHGLTHQWFEADPVYTHLRAFMPLRVGPTVPGTIGVTVHRGIVWAGAYYKHVVGAESLSLSGYIPPSGYSRFVLISVSTAGTIVVTPGDIFESDELYLYSVPDAPDGTVCALAAVRLYDGQTEVGESLSDTDIMDLRFPMKHTHPEYMLQDLITFTAQPDDTLGNDTYIMNSSETNYATSDSIVVGHNATASTWGRGLLKFDISAIPASANVVSAVLRLWTKESFATNNADLRTHRMNRAWVENQATWTLYGTGLSWIYAGIWNPFEISADHEHVHLSSTLITSDTDEYVEIQIALGASSVQQWIDGTYTNHGLMLRMEQDAGDAWSFWSSHCAVADYRPKLEIIYYVGGDVATDKIWNALGDLAVGTGVDTAVVLPVGTDGQTLSVDSGEATGLKWVDPESVMEGTREGQFLTTGASPFTAEWSDGYLHIFPDKTLTITDDLTIDDTVANLVFAGPASGADAFPTFRGLDHADLPDVIALKDASVLQISSGEVTISASYHIIKAYNISTFDLDTINGGVTNQLLLMQADPGDTITVKHGTGNIVITGGIDISLTGDKTVELFYDGTNWTDVGGGGGGGGDVATDTIWDTKGDMAIGSGANAATILPVGTVGQTLIADPAATLGVRWVDPSGGVYGETIAATGTAFATASTFVADSLQVYLNGVRQDATQYTEAVGHDGFDTVFTVAAGDVLTVDYNMTTSISIDVAAYVRPAIKVWMSTNFN